MDTPTSPIYTPALRKNRRLESKWGLTYYAAVKNAVFSQQCAPYSPPKLPPSMSKDIEQDESLYICKQCKDCFRFQSTYDEHIVRKSWILGYWCLHCFLTICTHVSKEGSPCSLCIKLDRDKRAYLRTRGLHKSRKLGVAKVFYNQCQFFAHLRSHSISLVDMADLMLMPIPTNAIGSEWSSELETACEAIMEHAFILRKHVLEFLKDRNAEHTWWKSDTHEEILKVIKGYRGRFFFNSRDTVAQGETWNSIDPQYLKNSSGVSVDIGVSGFVNRSHKRKTSPQKPEPICTTEDNVIEYEDNPCTSADMAFVDCGPAPKSLTPEVSVNNISRKHTTIFVQSNPGSPKFQPANIVKMYNKRKKLAALLSKCNQPDVTLSYGNTTITPKTDPLDHAMGKAVEITKHDGDKKIDSYSTSENLCEKVNKQDNSVDSEAQKNPRTPTVNAGHKILTFQNSKNIDITSIISQLSPQLTNSKRIVVIGQDSDCGFNHKQEPMKKLVQISEVTGKNVKTVQASANVISKETSGCGEKDNEDNVVKITSPAKSPGGLFHNKIIYQNGRKYLIKQTMNVAAAGRKLRTIKQVVSEVKSSTPTPSYSKESENISGHERLSGSQNDISPLTPSPSPSELSSSSSCDVQLKQGTVGTKSVKLNASQTDAECPESGANSDCHENLSFHISSDDNLYLTVKPIKQKIGFAGFDTNTMITKCKQEMLNEFFHLPYADLKKKFTHLQIVRNEIVELLRCVAENVVKEKLKALHILKHVLKHCMEKVKTDGSDSAEEDILNEWETEYESQTEKPTCDVCKKVMKPKSYIPGFSKPAKDDNAYCACYKHLCNKCEMYQGNSTRFIAHQNYHRKLEPFLCPDCYQRFASFKLLEVHTWTVCFHTLKKRVFRCKICEIDGFQDIESITAHFGVMHSNTKIACNVCSIVVPSYADYKKHMQWSHPSKAVGEPIRVVLCKLDQCIVRYENYMAHMEKHLIEQRLVLWFRCPFCPFIDLEAKQVMRHLQDRHLHPLSGLISPEALWDILPENLAMELTKQCPEMTVEEPSTKFVDETLPEHGMILPKIINTRTITSEVFEQGAQEIDDESVDQSTDMSQKKLQVKDRNTNNSWHIQFDLGESIKMEGFVSNAAMNINDQCTMLPEILDVRSIADTESRNSVITDDLTGNPGQAHSEERHKTNETRQVSIAVMSPETINLQSIRMDKCDGKVSNETPADLNDSPRKHEGEQVHSVNRMLQPPPLARIPQYILDQSATPVEDTGCKPEVQSSKPSKERPRCQSQPRIIKPSRRSISRIALNGPNNSQEEVLAFRCHLCDDLINTSWSVISTHYKAKHSEDHKLSSVSPKLLKMSPEFIAGGYKELLSGKKRKLENPTFLSKRRRRWTAKKYTSDTTTTNVPGLGLCVEQETAEDGEGNFRCKKCNQRCNDMASLREHIASDHRIKGRYLICLECGENFVVVPSLQMHLKAFHGIEDPITYMAKNTSYAPDNLDDSDDEDKTTDANQCCVCMAVFENKAAVDKHLRVHGMAFLNRKMIEARNATKSPEKIDKTDNGRRSPRKESPNKDSPSKELTKRTKSTTSILERISTSI